MRVEQLLKDSGVRQLGATALIAGKTRRSYGELDLMSSRLGAGIATHGIVPGNRVVLFMDNGWEAVVALFAVLKAGGVVCAVDPETKSDRLSHILNRSHASGIITQARLAAIAGRAIAETSTVPLVTLVGADCSPAGFGCLRFEDAIRGVAELAIGSILADDDIALLDAESAETTTHADLVASTGDLASDLGSLESDIVLMSMPLSDEFGLRQMLAAVKVGAALVIDNEFSGPQSIFRKIGDEGATGIALSRFAIDGIAQTGAAQTECFPALRYVAGDMAAASTASVARIGELFPTAQMVFTANRRRRGARGVPAAVAGVETRARAEPWADGVPASARIG